MEKSLYRLERLTRVLRIVGLFCFSLTVLCVVISFLTLFNLSRVDSQYLSSNFRSYYRSYFYASLVAGILALILVVFYETLRKQGESLFEEISDELEWHILAEPSKQSASPTGERPSLSARIVLRSFVRATDLPLVPGKFGPSLYAGINLLAIVTEILFLRGMI